MIHQAPTALDVAAFYGVTKASGAYHGEPVYHIPCPGHRGEDRNCHIWQGDNSIAGKCQSRQCDWRAVIQPAIEEDMGTMLYPTREVARAMVNGTPETAAQADYSAAKFREAHSMSDEAMGAVACIEQLPRLFLVPWDDERKDGEGAVYVIGKDGGTWRDCYGDLFRSTASNALEAHFDDVGLLMAAGKLKGADLTRLNAHARRIRSKDGMKRVGEYMPTIALNMRLAGKPADGLIECLVTDLDRGPFIGAPNGIIDLRSGVFLQGAEAAARMVTKRIRDPYDDEAKHPMAETLFRHPSLSDEESQFLLRSFAYALLGEPHVAKRLYAIFDESQKGFSGKSTLFETLTNVLGDYCGEFDRSALHGKDSQNSGRATPEKEPFTKFRLCYNDEAAKLQSDVSVVNGLTGNASVNYRMLHKDPINRPNVGSMFVLLNGIPDFDLSHGALFARYVPIHLGTIPTAQRIQSLKALSAKDTADARKFRQAVMAMLVEAAYENEGLPPPIPASIEALKKKHHEMYIGDDGLFILRHAVSGSHDDYLTTAALWEAWCAESDRERGDDAAERAAKGAFTKKASRLLSQQTVSIKRDGQKKQTMWTGFKFGERCENEIDAGPCRICGKPKENAEWVECNACADARCRVQRKSHCGLADLHISRTVGRGDSLRSCRTGTIAIDANIPPVLLRHFHDVVGEHSLSYSKTADCRHDAIGEGVHICIEMAMHHATYQVSKLIARQGHGHRSDTGRMRRYRMAIPVWCSTAEKL